MRELLHHHIKLFIFCSLAAITIGLIFVHPIRAFIRRHGRILAILAGVIIGAWLRIEMVLRFPLVAGDSLFYGDIAKNLLQHGIYAISTPGGLQPTYVRLPGYPLFLAALFKIFGMEHYGAAMFIQVFIDLGTCFVVSALTREIILAQPFAADDPSRARRPALIAFLLTAFCPFFITYVGAPLTEIWSIFLTALTLYLAVKGLRALFGGSAGYWKWWLACGFALSLNIYFRPDGGILLAIAGAVLFPLLFKFPRRTFAAGIITLVAVVLMLAPWTVRNWRTMHRFEPLAPRYANDPEDFVSLGFDRWLKTWVIDFISVANVEWHVPGEKIDMDDLPTRACDSLAECDQTESALDDYNHELDISPEIDAEFGQLAEQRIRRHPLRYYILLPALRVTDMWLRPRVEILPLDLDWWKIDENGMDSWIAIALGSWNLILLFTALIGVFRNRPRPWGLNEATLIFALLIGFVVMRSLFLTTIENPEPRYVLECYPVVLAFAGAAFVRKASR